jgi:uncharacterized protein (DUF2235 family)
MKRIVICCDGTWNKGDQKYATNVVKLRNALKLTSATGVKQMPYYLDGVGTKSWVDRLPGGVFGSGLWQNVQKAYRHLVEYYEPEDEIYLFGFSRGAYTARSVVGMLRKCGILKRDRIGEIESAYDFYRNRDVKPVEKEAVDFRLERSLALAPGEPGFENVPRVKFIGVWDTVGSLGIPLGTLGRVFNRKHRFHDVSLSRTVDNAYHALAIDEGRRPFAPTLWEKNPHAEKQVMSQVWFAGVHTNIGGGNADARQSDRALLWMMAKARSCGLEFDPTVVETFANDLNGTIPQSTVHRLFAAAPFGVLTHVRQIDAGRARGVLSSVETVDPGVVRRDDWEKSYKPENLGAYFQAYPEVRRELLGASSDVWR